MAIPKEKADGQLCHIPETSEAISQREILVRIDGLRELMLEKISALKETAVIAYPNREEYALLEKKVASLENLWAKLEGKATQSQAMFAIAISLLSAVTTIAALVWNISSTGK